MNDNFHFAHANTRQARVAASRYRPARRYSVPDGCDAAYAGRYKDDSHDPDRRKTPSGRPIPEPAANRSALSRQSPCDRATVGVNHRHTAVARNASVAINACTRRFRDDNASNGANHGAQRQRGGNPRPTSAFTSTPTIEAAAAPVNQRTDGQNHDHDIEITNVIPTAIMALTRSVEEY